MIEIKKGKHILTVSQNTYDSIFKRMGYIINEKEEIKKDVTSKKVKEENPKENKIKKENEFLNKSKKNNDEYEMNEILKMISNDNNVEQ